jgi:hypothetical protein
LSLHYNSQDRSLAVRNPNPKSETRNPKQIQKSKIGKAQKGERERVFGIASLDFGFVSDFGFRASDLDRKLSVAAWPR